VLVKTILLSRLIVVWTQPELKIPKMICCYLYLHIDHLPLFVLSNNGTGCHAAARLMVKWLFLVIRVAANAAPAAVVAPLMLESSAVELVVVIIDRCVESITPSTGTSRGYLQSPMGANKVNRMQTKDKTENKHRFHHGCDMHE